ncbi:hypothetical protein CFP75_05180 [Amycolatopsis alba DSM 44262]|uniref:Uncharacterized protein n=1 Tax=Amycolatopsis alba DSM 44262 TaxID=1125972 RepID=A0A229S694_AMYAL|nr:hypothetical protein CFP75_05180 [Amycolatopsis alba DSM 44262]
MNMKQCEQVEIKRIDVSTFNQLVITEQNMRINVAKLDALLQEGDSRVLVVVFQQRIRNRRHSYSVRLL